MNFFGVYLFMDYIMVFIPISVYKVVENRMEESSRSNGCSDGQWP